MNGTQNFYNGALDDKRLKGVQIECLPAIELIKRYDTEDVFIYADPPYLHSTRKNYLYKHEMTDAEHIELLEALINHPGKVLLSGYDNVLKKYLERCNKNMRLIDKVRNCIHKFTEYEKEYEEICQKARERKENSIKEQIQYMKKCPICGNEDFIQSRGITTYNSATHFHSSTAELNVITDKEKYPDGASYPIHTKICRKCGNATLFLSFQELDEMYFYDESGNTN